jgi:hypothetical protein
MTVTAVPVRTSVSGRVTLLMPVAACGALALALRAPLATTVLGLIAFGVLHNVLEIRYVAGRFASVLRGDFLLLLVALISGIVVCRAVTYAAPGARVGAGYAEILLGYVVLAVGCRRTPRRWSVLAGLAVACVVSLRWPAYHFVVLAHLHNVVPLVFLWEWARRLPSARLRAGFRAAQVGWVLVVPALLLAGLADPWLRGGSSVVRAFVGDGHAVLGAVSPPGTTIGLRFLAVFAFLQTMHYVVWVGFLPRFAPDAAGAFDARVPWLRGRRAWYCGLVGGAFLAILFVSDYTSGRALYGALASYHAYLEFPVLLALMLGRAVVRSELPVSVDGTRGE